MTERCHTFRKHSTNWQSSVKCTTSDDMAYEGASCGTVANEGAYTNGLPVTSS